MISLFRPFVNLTLQRGGEIARKWESLRNIGRQITRHRFVGKSSAHGED